MSVLVETNDGKKMDSSMNKTGSSVSRVPAKAAKLPEGPSRNTFRDEITRLDVDFTGELGKLSGKFISKRIHSNDANNIFKARSYTSNTVNGFEEPQSIDLSKVIIKGVRVSHTQNTFPFSVAFDMEESGIPSACCTMEGVSCAFIIRSGEQGERAIYQDVHTALGATDDGFLKRYAHVSADKLKQGFARVPNEDYSLIKGDHEIMKIISLPDNQRNLNYKVSEFASLGSSFAVPNKICDRALDELNRSILQNLKFHDLTNFGVRMRRADGKDLSDISGTSKGALLSESERNLALKDIHTASCTLEIKWAYPCRDTSTNAADDSTYKGSPVSSSQMAKLQVRN